MVNALKMGLIPCCAHLAAQREKAVNETEGFVVSSRSKLDPYQDDLLYVCVIVSLWTFFAPLVCPFVERRLSGHRKRTSFRHVVLS